MRKEDLKIIFMGTPDFAVESLRCLVENNYNVIGVITSPDKPSGRGQKLNQSAVKKYALEKKLTILQQDKLKDKLFLKNLKNLNANLQIVVAFRMLPKEVWGMPQLGTFNLHSSLLPNYRGAAPINWAIINGETETGITTFLLDEKIDTGNILLQKKVSISNDMNAGELHDILMMKGGELVLETLEGILKNTLTPKRQADYNFKNINEAPKIFREDCKIDWDDNLKNIYNKIRGLNPYPGAWTKINLNDKELTLKIFDITLELNQNQNTHKYIFIEKRKLKIFYKDGSLTLDTLQLEGKKKINSKDFINGIVKPYQKEKLCKIAELL